MQAQISCHADSADAYAAEIVVRALQRSFTKANVDSCVRPMSQNPATKCVVLINPIDVSASCFEQILASCSKIVLFGDVSEDIAVRIGLLPNGVTALSDDDIHTPQCFDAYCHESNARIRYSTHPLAQATPIQERSFCRYDYAEWNNLGYGAVRQAGSAFGISGGRQVGDATVLAHIAVDDASGSRDAGAYATILDTPHNSVLWCARPVGLVDSVEWQLIERFFCDWRCDSLYCAPCLLQTPHGVQCIVTMRLDCDEDAGSAYSLFEWYKREEIPFSLAVKTEQDFSAASQSLFAAVRESGGTLLSHSATHPQNWGVDYQQAFEEASRSKAWFSSQWPGYSAPTLAVSPFHTNPVYAVTALEAAGYTGFVGGVIDNDPEFLLGRAGEVPFASRILSLSQQSMLHGDSYHNQNNTVDVHIQAFEFQYKSRGIFGYLDHPFSARYQYGWQSEDERLAAHACLVHAIRTYPGVVFWSQQQCFDHLERLRAVELRVDASGCVKATSSAGQSLEYRYRGEEFQL